MTITITSVAGPDEERAAYDELRARNPQFSEDDERDPGQRGPCPRHSWVFTGTQYGGDDESYSGEGRCYCEYCGADGDA